MSFFQDVSVLVVKQVLADRAESLLGFLGDRFSDNARRLEDALTAANDRAWRCLEIALAGPSWLGGMFRSRDETNLAAQVRAFLDKLPLAALGSDASRKACLAELQSARRVKLVPGSSFGAHAVVGDPRTFARYGDRAELVEHERRLVLGIAAVLRDQKYLALADYVSLRPADGDPLLVQAARHFFRRAVEDDPRLSAGLTLDRLDGIASAQKSGFDALGDVLMSHGDKVEALLGGVTGFVTATREEVKGVRDDVGALREQVVSQTARIAELSDMLRAMLHRPPASARPGSAMDQVRGLLATAKTVTVADPGANVELGRVAAKLGVAAYALDATREAIAELRPEEAETILDALPAAEEPTLRRMEGRLISELFTRRMPAEPEPVQEEVKAEPAKSRLISPIFERE